MPGVPERFLTEKCVGCKKGVTEEQFIATQGICEDCFQQRVKASAPADETPAALQNLVNDLEDAEDAENRATRAALDPEDLDGWDR